jgi:CRISPR-associated endonuclease/helicase Cas3
MLLSRALNRGYATSRFRWPVQFGLLNNDCLWVMDEIQLMGSGLATTTQFQAFRRKLGTAFGIQSLWMSATIRPEWLATVDFDHAHDAPGAPLGLGVEDKKHKVLKERFEAVKNLEAAPFEATGDGKGEAELALERHSPGTRTLVVVNTVKRAQAIYQVLRKRKAAVEVVLVHSRFRPPDREAALHRLLAEPGEQGVIGVCTQVVEAGVDVSAKTLITDLAPWGSLVQRFGRCNRRGEFGLSQEAKVIWIAPANLSDDKNLKPAPYLAEELRAAARQLGSLADVGPSKLPPFEDRLSFANVVRRKDVVELFDTTPDLAGADLDISRFIRETDRHDLLVFWRDVPDAGPSPDEPGPARAELCSVPVGDLDPQTRAMWRWDHLQKAWERPRVLCPGMVLMLRAAEGGYAPDVGWIRKETNTAPLAVGGAPPEANEEDLYVKSRVWKTLSAHTEEVVKELEGLIGQLPLGDSEWAAALRLAARWHDAGKAHPVFQGAVKDPPRDDCWGKAVAMAQYRPRGFRHELASALAMLGNRLPDLAAYLAAAHHGKVRLSIRSLPNERPPDGSPKRFARGVSEGDMLPETVLGGGVVMPATTLRLSFMDLGSDEETGPSWLARTLALRDGLGPFRLAFLEALLRVADWRASRNGEEGQG